MNNPQTKIAKAIRLNILNAVLTQKQSTDFADKSFYDCSMDREVLTANDGTFINKSDFYWRFARKLPAV